MQVNNINPSQLMDAIQINTQKKAQDVVKNVIGNLLEKTFENTMKIQEEVAKTTGAGANLNIKA
ncbi:hypothetical protein JCM11957_09920 [Caminibacter profundus]